MDTYRKEGDHVFVSELHNENERAVNERLATFLGEKTGDVVYLLPHIQPTQRDAERLRKEYFPKGVKENKNPDFYFRGRFVDGKCMTSIIVETDDSKVFKRKIQNRLENAFEQAEDALLEIPTWIPLELIKEAIRGKLSSSRRLHIVYVKYGDEMVIFEGK